MSAVDIKKLNIYIDNGDKELTLCRSNEELHILMRNLNIPHEFRVRDGGHSFQYWCSALPNALQFISDAFEGKIYRGDNVPKVKTGQLPEKQLRTFTINTKDVFVFVPSEYDQTNRLYPVIYFAGKFSESQRKMVAASVNFEIENNNVSPMLMVFLPENTARQLKTMLPELEEKLRIRKGYRFRALAGYQDEATDVATFAINKEQFSTCILTDGFLLKDSISGLLTAMNPKALERTVFFITAPDNGNYFEGNGAAHMLLRDLELQHEYRVSEGRGGFDWFLAGWPEIIRFTAKRFHK